MKKRVLPLLLFVLLFTSFLAFGVQKQTQVLSNKETTASIGTDNRLESQKLVEEEFDPIDVAALKAIRDNAPTNSVLKVNWADETKISSWTGVTWSGELPHKVISLSLNGKRLNSLDVSRLSMLETMSCSDNDLTYINVSGLSRLKYLYCQNNKLSFGRLTLKLPITGGSYVYSPQKLLYEERAVIAGEMLDYSFEALVNGSQTVYTWYKDNTKIEGTDQSGKYTPLIEGYYYCKMTNDLFPGLTLITSEVKIQLPSEFDLGDIAILKLIRDHAPANSTLKTAWADETKVGTWSGVTWTDLKSKRVKELGLYYCGLIDLDVSLLAFLEKLNCQGNSLLSLNVTGLKNLTTLDCQNNILTSIDLTGVPLLKYMNCSYNSIPFSKLPVRLPIYNGYYTWQPQNSVFEERSISLGDEIDFSSEAILNGRPSTFDWYAFGILIKTEQTGKFTPKEEGYYYCKIASSYFTGFVETTRLVKVGNPSEYDIQNINALKAIRDNAPADSPLKTLWADDSKVATWKGVTWSQSPSKKVIYLDLYLQKLVSIDVRQITHLLTLDCQLNNLTSINVSGLNYLARLTCSDNNLKFSTLPMIPTIRMYGYSPQKMIDTERTIAMGETIDYSSEAIIDGVPTIFTWYKNNTKIENADQSGKFSPAEEGYYYCVLTNSKFPLLALASNPINVGVSPDYDAKDVEALRTIRDKAPNDSPLKTEWADETKFSTWPGVKWESSVKPKKVTSLNVNNKKLTELDVSQLWLLTELYCGENSITRLDLTKLTELYKLICWSNRISQLVLPEFSKLYFLECSSNKLSFSQLPLKYNQSNYFRYYTQTPYDEERTINLGETIDFSSELNIGGIGTVYIWYRNNEKISGTDKTGKYTPIQEGSFYCTMTNSKFPLITITSNIFKVGYSDAYFSQDINTVKSIRDNAPSDSPLKTLWADESKMANWEGIGWSPQIPHRILSLNLNDKKLVSLDLRQLTLLENLYCSRNSLVSLNVSGLSNLMTLICNNNKLSSLDLTGTIKAYHVECCANKIPFSKLPSVTRAAFKYGYYIYSPQTPFDEQHLIIQGESIDFSTEANVEGVSTKFTWYYGDFKIRGTDQSGKYTPTKEGYYSCSMTNENFPSLIIKTGLFKLGEPIEYIQQDIAALKNIRDLAPINCPLKNLWADETKISSWAGVVWSNLPPRGVKSLDVSSKLLSNLDVSKLSYLESLFCSDNNLQSIDVAGTNVNYLICNNNKIPFSKLIIQTDRNNLDIKQTYSPQNLLFEERTISVGETIDFSSESLIDGISTVYSWYRNGVKILNTDQSGKFTPSEEGYYYCTMTNLKFSELVLTTNQIIVGNPPEFDLQDVAALKAIRDNAPTNSRLKTDWADESKVGNWYGVTWSDVKSKKVKSLSVTWAELKTLNVSQLTFLEQIYCNNNQLSSVDLTGLNKLKEYNCSTNLLAFSTLPLRLPIPGGSFTYFPQGVVGETRSISSGETIDYSSEVLIDGVSTVYTWYKNNVKIENTNQTGKYTPLTEGYYYCTLTNAKFPKLTLTTNVVKVGSPPEFDPQEVMSLRSIRDNAPTGSPLKTLWPDDKNIGTWAGVVWSQLPVKKVKELNIQGNNLSSLNLSTFSSLEKLDCSSNRLTTLDLSMLANLQYLSCGENQLTSINIVGLTRLSSLYCHGNQLLFSKLPLRLPVPNGSYYYTNQRFPTTPQPNTIGSILDYSSEAIIDGISTKYSWYRNGILITGTDNTGKFTVKEEGYYFCVLSNSKFPDLTITTSQVKVGSPQEYDPQDVLALKTIRDNAPSDSPLKNYWVNDAMIGAWQGVTWTTILPRKVIRLSLSNMKLTALDIKQLMALEQLYCYNNQLIALDVSGLSNLLAINCQNNQLPFVDISTLTKLYSFDCSNNKIPFSKLPLKLPSSYGSYYYSPQNPFGEEHAISLGETIDFSSEALIGGVATSFVWYRNNIKIEGTDNSGKLVPSSEGFYYCKISNSKFSNLTLTSVQTKVGNPIEFDPQDIAALKAIRDNAPTDSPLRTLWIDSKPIINWAGVYWNELYPHQVKVLDLQNMKLASLDVTQLASLESLNCSNNLLKTLKIEGLSNLTSISCTFNQLDAIDLSANQKVKYLNCDYNKISFSKLPLQLPVMSGYYRYSPQNPIYETREITAGEMIDYSSEAIIDGVPTVFSWFKNNIQIRGTDQTGRYAPTEEGYYSCQMTNSKFAGLTINTNALKIGSPSDLDLTDVDVLKAIRDNAPSGSPLKTSWADESKIRSWAGVSWTQSVPSRVSSLNINNAQLVTLNIRNLSSLIQLYCNRNNLISLDLSGLSNLWYIDCSNNNLTTIDLTGITRLNSINCSNNNLSLSTLPLLPYNIPYYYCSPQKLLFEEKSISLGETIDYSSESIVRSQATYFTWYKDNVRIDQTDQTGKFKPTSNGTYHCTMFNYTFGNLTLTTNKTYVGTSLEYNNLDVNALKSIRDKAPADSPLKLEWVDENQIGTWEGVKWSIDNPKRVIELAISGKKLKELDVSSFVALGKLECNRNELAILNVTGLSNLNSINCSYNQLTAISIYKSPKIQNLYCDNNKIPFSSLPVRLPISGGTYKFSPMNQLFEVLPSIPGEPINYILESVIDGSRTGFTWYKNGVKIEGPDQTGKYIPLEEGEYNCTMTNIKFPELTQVTNLVKVTSLPEFDMNDVEALKRLRDGAPSNSPLKVKWADDSKFSTWEGVDWTSYPTKKVKILQLSNMSLKTIDVTSLPGLEQLYCNNNQLTSLKISGLLNLNYLSFAYNQPEAIDITGLPKIANLFCHNNKIRFSKLPIRLSVSGGNYQYWPQQLIFEARNIALGETIDYSSEALIDGVATDFTWYKNNVKVEGTDQSGKYKPTVDGNFHCLMTNSKFPGLTLTTNSVKAVIPVEFDPQDVAALKEIRNNAVASSPLKTDWPDEAKVGSWVGVTWSETYPQRVITLQVSLKNLNALDVTKLTSLVQLNCSNNQLLSLNTAGLTMLQKIDCQNNNLSSLDLSRLSSLSELTCGNNGFTFSKLPVRMPLSGGAFQYSPQRPTDVGHTILLGETIDYSSEALIDGVATDFTWYKNNVKVEGTDQSGKFKPTSYGSYHCTMTNAKFPGLTLQTSTITIVDKMPVANAGGVQVVNEGTLVSLDGTASVATGNGSLTYLWTPPAGITLSSNTESKPTFTAPEVSANTDYIFSLVVNEGTDSSLADQVLISVLQVNKAPVAIAGNYQEKNEGEEVTLDGSGSFDADGNAITCNWSAPVGITLSSTTDVKPTFTAPMVSQDTPYTFTLMVNDGTINSTKSEVIVKIRKGYPKVKLVSKLNNSMISAKDVSYQLFSKIADTFQERNLSSVTKGDTTLISLDPGEWIILASPIQKTFLFVPTYVGNVLTWNQAEHIIIPEQGSVYKEISCIQSIPTITGTGEISGYVVENDKAGTKSISIYKGSVENNKPIAGAMINLFKKGGLIPVLSVFSDSNGYYKFDRLEITDYEIVVELPGFTQSEKFGVKISDNAPLVSVQFVVNTNFQTITDVNSIVLIGLKVYPNPVFDFLTIDLEDITSRPVVSVYNIKGELLLSEILDESKTVIDFSRYPSGHYVVRVLMKDNLKSFIIQK